MQGTTLVNPSDCFATGLTCLDCVRSVAQEVRGFMQNIPRESALELFPLMYPSPACEPMKGRFVLLTTIRHTERKKIAA